MIITIAGPSGSGKDTVAEIIAEKINLKLISMGNIRREAAREKGMTLEEFNDWSLKNPKEGDIYFDEYQRRYGQENDNFIMVSRLGWNFISHSKKIYIDVDAEIGAERIFNQKRKEGNKRNEKKVSSVEEQRKINEYRIKSDIERYQKQYGVNPYEKEHYDLVIDSTNLSINEVVEICLDSILKE
jgi:predicted cytidylate kinase